MQLFVNTFKGGNKGACHIVQHSIIPINCERNELSSKIVKTETGNCLLYNQKYNFWWIAFYLKKIYIILRVTKLNVLGGDDEKVIFRLYVRHGVEEGVKITSVYDMEDTKFAEAYKYVFRFMNPFHNVPGFTFSIEVYLDPNEVIETIKDVIGMDIKQKGS